MIEVIQNLGDDALANLFEIAISPISFIDDLNSTLLRVQNFTIPATGAETYDVHYKTQKMTKIGGKVDAPNEFTFNIRVDRNWLIYKSFIAWKNAVANPTTGVIMTDGAANPFRVPISAWATDGDGNKISSFGQWSFNGCFCKNVSEVSFDYSNGEPVVSTITMGYVVMVDNLL